MQPRTIDWKTLAIAALLLLPSAWLLWSTSDIPRFGDLHDDALYFASAKSLTDGGGYRIESLPGEPAQTKYPPLYPLLISMAWRINPEFPANLPIAAWLSWLAMPAILFALAIYYPQLGFSRRRTWILLALFATNSYVMLFSTQLLTELWFLALTLASMLALERALASARSASQSPYIWIAIAAVFAGLSYLTRSAGLAMLAGGAAYLWFAQQRKLAAIFAASILPFIAGWMLWARSHQMPTDEPAVIYYVDYFRYHLLSFDFSQAHVFLWKNIDGFLWGLGALIVPKVASSGFLKIASQVIAVAMISGTVRLLRKGQAQLLGWFALFSSALLIVWHFPPNERFVLPLFPLALAGLSEEGKHLLGMIRQARHHKKRDQRIAGNLLAGAVALFAMILLAGQAWVGLVYLPMDAENHRETRREREQVYAWIRTNTDPAAALLSSDDAVLYLYTGRHAMTRPLPPQHWYLEQHDEVVRWGSDVAGFAAQQGLGYFDFAGVKASQGLPDEDAEAIEAAIAQSPDLNKQFASGSAVIYAIHPPAATAPSVATTGDAH